ncbi:MAG: DUF547 domain-containing protein [Bdellovibrionales bacterium]|nr:DUF547 domain-containing protein [Bdellovibrionales bacterium]
MKSSLRLYFFALLIFISTQKANALDSFDHTHGSWTQILQEFGTENKNNKNIIAKINYSKLKKSSKLKNYLNTLADVISSQFSQFNKEQQLAFLINAYNSQALNIIAQNDTKKSLHEMGSAFEDFFHKKSFRLFREDKSLDDLNQELRSKGKDPRIFFALSCGAVSCPPLMSRAYTANNLNEQLDHQTKSFLQDKSQNEMFYTKRKYRLSKIFKTYQKDFEINGDSVQKFVGRYITEDPNIKKYLSDGNFTLEYMDFNERIH